MKNFFFSILVIVLLIMMVATVGALLVKFNAGQVFLSKTVKTEGVEEAVNQEMQKKKIIFRYEAPANKVEIIGDFTQWYKKPMKKQNANNWYIIQELPMESFGYNFIVDDMEILDPTNLQKGTNPDGKVCSVIHVK
ncbi:MAG: hypothetical protein ABII27_01300 [bacterium]